MSIQCRAVPSIQAAGLLSEIGISGARKPFRRAAAIVRADGLEPALESCQDRQDWRSKAFTEHHARKSDPRDRPW
jgi:hypothetical protein